MNKDQLRKNVGRRVRFRPAVVDARGAEVNTLWQVVDVGDDGAHVRDDSGALEFVLPFDAIFNYDTDAAAPGTKPIGILNLHATPRIGPDGRFTLDYPGSPRQQEFNKRFGQSPSPLTGDSRTARVLTTIMVTGLLGLVVVVLVTSVLRSDRSSAVQGPTGVSGTPSAPDSSSSNSPKPISTPPDPSPAVSKAPAPVKKPVTDQSNAEAPRAPNKTQAVRQEPNNPPPAPVANTSGNPYGSPGANASPERTFTTESSVMTLTASLSKTTYESSGAGVVLEAIVSGTWRSRPGWGQLSNGAWIRVFIDNTDACIMYESTSVNGSGLDGFLYAKNSTCGPSKVSVGPHMAIFDFGGLLGTDPATNSHYSIWVPFTVK